MKIDIDHIAKLSKLSIPEEKKEKFQKEMNNILDMVEKLPDVSMEYTGVDKNDPMILRKDELSESIKRDELLKNAPQTKAGCIVVPKTIEE